MSGRMRERTGRYRIVVNAIHARAGGGVTYLRNLLPLLAAEPDLELHFIPPRGWKDAFGALSPTIHVHDVAMPGRWVSVLLWEQLVLPFIVWRIGFDAVFSPANFAPLALPAQVIVIQNAVTVGRHENRIGKRVYWFTLRMMTTLSLLTVRRAIAVSQYVADTAMPPLRHASLSVIHHGVGAAFSPALVAQPPGDYLLAVGDLYIQKNLDRLIEAFSVIRRRYPAMTLRIAGTSVDGEYAAALHRRVAALDLGGAVVFAGRQTTAALVELYHGCAVFVLPSSIESFGMPLVEAMACGAPVVASSGGAIPEIAGGAAELCDPGDPQDIAETILRVLDDPALRRSLCERSLRRAKDFSWVDCARRTADVLRDAASGRVNRVVPVQPRSP
jgi:glycosyltransferase involved in cell wall biosynthesis